MTHATRALQSEACPGRELTLDHMHNTFTTQGHGGPPRMSDQLNVAATSEPNHCNMANMNLVDLKLTFVLRVRKNPEKHHPAHLSRLGLEPGPAA